jgi:ABC-type glycerol-3-phosphate transport system substrate-binding protein
MLTMVSATVLLSGALTGSVASAQSESTEVLTVMSDWTGTDQVKFEGVVKAFSEKTGIPVTLEGTTDFLTVLNTRVAAGDLPMVAIVPRPGVYADFANQGLIKSLDELGVTTFTDSYQPAWVDLGSVDGVPYAITVKANSKSMIWDRPADLEAAGGAPATLDDFKALMTTMAESGNKPLVVSAKDAWTLTDWFENIYYRTAGPEKYADLFGGVLPFTDESVVDALKVTEDLIANDTWLNGGREIALSTGYQDGLAQVFGTNPVGDFFMEGGFTGSVVINDVNTSLVPGTDIAFFPFPDIDPQYTNAVVGGGDFAIAFSDSEPAKQFMAYLATPEAAAVWAENGVISPNKDLDLSIFTDPLVKAEAEQLTQAALFAFDGSDLLPGALGDQWPTVLQGIYEDPSTMTDQLAAFEEMAAAEFGR